MSRASNRRRNAERSAQRRAHIALEKYGDSPDPIFRHCPTCGASPRTRCARDTAPLAGNYHPARHEAAKTCTGISGATVPRTRRAASETLAESLGYSTKALQRLIET